MKSALLVLSIFAVSGITFAAPSDLKAVYLEDNEIPDKRFVKKGATAEFGGFRAAAGVGGLESGAGLFAAADFPGANANAGAYGTGSSASAGAGAGAFDYGRPRPPTQSEGGFFDRIFAIPINVLHSVNSYVKTKGTQGQGVYAENGQTSAGVGFGQRGAVATANAGAGAGVGAGVDGTGLRFGSEESSASASASSSNSAFGTSNLKPDGKPDYDKIFNIPISALKSVNDLLNG